MQLVKLVSIWDTQYHYNGVYFFPNRQRHDKPRSNWMDSIFIGNTCSSGLFFKKKTTCNRFFQIINKNSLIHIHFLSLLTYNYRQLWMYYKQALSHFIFFHRFTFVRFFIQVFRVKSSFGGCQRYQCFGMLFFVTQQQNKFE